MSSPGLAGVVRSGLWIYLSSIISSLSGFIYWVVISAIGGTDVVGLTSATVALAGIVTGFLSLGEEAGVQRFLGACRGRGDDEGVAEYFWTVTLFRIATFTPVGLMMMALGSAGLSLGSLTADMLFFAGLIVALSSITIFDSLLASHLETKPIFLGSIVGNALRLPLGICLILMGWGWVGAVLGYIVAIPASFIVKFFPSFGMISLKTNLNMRALRDVLRAGVASWLPGIIAILGQQLGVLTLFGIRGASETGLYYVSFSMMGALMGIGGSILGLMMPVLSGMEDGRKRASWRAIRISLILTTPLAFILAAYPEEPLGLLGRDYLDAAPMLTVLSLTIPVSLISAGVTSLLYAYGMYTSVLILGLIGSVSRIVTYAPLSRLMGGSGVALSYAFGAYAAFASTIIVCRKLGLNPGLREALLITSIPLCLAIAFHQLSMAWFVGAPLLLLLSYIGYLRIGVLDRGDLRELAYALAPEHVVNEMYQHLRPVIDRLID